MTTRFLRLPEVKFRTGLSRSTIYQMISENRFPRPTPLGARSVGWLDQQISTWIENTINKNPSIPAKKGGEK